MDLTEPPRVDALLYDILLGPVGALIGSLLALVDDSAQVSEKDAANRARFTSHTDIPIPDEAQPLKSLYIQYINKGLGEKKPPTTRKKVRLPHSS